MDRRIAITLYTLLLSLAAPVGAAVPGHSARDATVENPKDGTQIAITIFKPAAAARRDVPVILHSHGWGGSRETSADGLVEPYLDAGFGVVSIDQRGHGESSGEAHVQDPARETEDIQAVIDYVATLDWIELEGPRDPVMGAIGGSYGGGFQTMTALDEIAESGATRFDALAPQITWYDLPQSLAPQGVPRSAWGTLLYAAGATMVPDFIHRGYLWSAATGQWPDGTLYGQPLPEVPDLDRIFHRHSPVAFVEKGIRLDVPVLLRQGASDNLFPLNEGLYIFERALTPRARRQSYFVSYNGGHALPNALPPGEPLAAELGTGTDACTKDFTATTIAFFTRVFAGKSTRGVLPARYNLTTLAGDRCLRLDGLKAAKPMEVDPTGAGVLALPAGAGAPLQIPLAQGPLTLAGIPVLAGKLTSAGLDTRLFFGLAVGNTPADARVIDNNLMPLRQVMPVQDERFAIELAGVVAEVPEGSSLFLTVTPVSDLFFGHGSRLPGAVVLSDVRLRLPAAERSS